MIYADTQSEQANRILESTSPIVISDLTVAEFHVGLARKVKLGELSMAQVDATRSLFESHMQEGLLQRVALRSSHSEVAGRLASTSSIMLRTLDALHLAVAVEVGSPIATFDTRLGDAARDLGFEVLP